MNTNKNIKKQTNEVQESVPASAQDQQYEMVGGVACPIDPQERLLCDSCQ